MVLTLVLEPQGAGWDRNRIELSWVGFTGLKHYVCGAGSKTGCFCESDSILCERFCSKDRRDCWGAGFAVEREALA